MCSNNLRVCVLPLFLAFAATAEAQPLRWRVVAAPAQSTIVPEGFPSDVQGYSMDETSQTGRLSLRLTRASSPPALWAQDQGRTWRPLAQLQTAGALGPGRVGEESSHIFSTLWEQDYSNGETFHLFAAIARPAGQVGGTVGLWVNDGTSNTEVARGETDGPLGPGLGPGVALISNTGVGNLALGRIQVLPGRTFALGGRVTSPARGVILLHREPGGFQTCAIEGPSDASSSPGISGPAQDQFVNLGGLAQGAGGELFSFGASRLLVISPTRVGIWRVCEGAPAVIALTDEQTALGPGVPGRPAAEFFSFSGELVPIGGGRVMFEARARLDSTTTPTPLVDALFLHYGSVNRPVATIGGDGLYGPGVPGFEFTDFDRLAGEGAVALVADVRRVGTSEVRSGLWRIGVDGPPEALAVENLAGDWAPGDGSVWTGFEDARALANGDVVAVARTRQQIGASEQRAIWQFRKGRSPRKILQPGDQVEYRSQTGAIAAGRLVALEGLSTGGSLLPAYAGDEGWINAEGDIALRGQIEGISSSVAIQLQGSLLNRSQVFADGFEP